MAITIRPERPADVESVRALNDAAFRGPVEGRIVDAVRGTPDWIAALSLVATDDDTGAIVGHVLVSRGRVERRDAPSMPILVLGPIAVAPDRQGEGIGSALMRRAIGAAVALAAPAVALVGHADWYPRFGFERGRALGLEPPDPSWPDPNWLVLRLPAWTPDLRGTVRFPPAFAAD